MATGALALATGCSFDASGLADTDAFQVAPPDGGQDDAGVCEDDIVVTMSADGAAEGAAPGGPLTRVLVGDTVELSAAGSCVASGPASYAWSISPVDTTGDTLAPSANDATITLFPTRPERYVVTLEVTDAAGESRSLSRYAIEAIGWQRLGDSDDDPLEDEAIAGVAAGADRLWIAGEAGGFVAPLADLSDVSELGETFFDDALDEELRAVTFGSQSAWFAAANKHDELWRVDVDADSLVQLDLDQDHEIRALAPLSDGVAVASRQGALLVSDSGQVTVLDDDLNLRAVATDAAIRWFGGKRLHREDALDEPVDPLAGDAGGDARIRGLDFGPGGELWIATREHGVIRADAQSGAGQVVYRAQESALPSDEVRAIAVERAGRFAGDVWVATRQGAARFKRDRGVWVAMGANQGLKLRADMNAITVAHPPGARGIYAGTAHGVVYLRVP